jgi:hypothetical protein
MRSASRQIENRARQNVALYSASLKPVSRGGGRSATAAAAYRNAERITDERTGEIHDYTRRSGVDHVEAFAPHGHAVQDSAELWNKAESAEVRKNARVAREVLVALPHELDQVQRRELAKSIAQDLADRYGTAGTLAVHHPDRDGDNRNHHVHILMTTRRLDASGQLGEKTRELDDVKRGPEEVEWIRAMIEAQTNRSLERAGAEGRVDRRSLVEQRAAALHAGDMDRAAQLDRPATIHEGPRVTQIRRESARKGRAPLGALDRAAANDHTRELVTDRAELGMVSAQVFNFEKARAERAVREQVAKTAADGMAAFKARFQQNQDFNARIDAERERMANELHRVALERAALERQEQAKAALKRFEKDQLSHDKGPSKGRGGPDFGM